MTYDFESKVRKRFLTLGAFVTLLGAALLMIGCQSASVYSSAKAIKTNVKSQSQTVFPNLPQNFDLNGKVSALSSKNKAIPFGVYDIQWGHGHGRWKKSVNSLVR